MLAVYSSQPPPPRYYSKAVFKRAVWIGFWKGAMSTWQQSWEPLTEEDDEEFLCLENTEPI